MKKSIFLLISIMLICSVFVLTACGNSSVAESSTSNSFVQRSRSTSKNDKSSIKESKDEISNSSLNNVGGNSTANSNKTSEMSSNEESSIKNSIINSSINSTTSSIKNSSISSIQNSNTSSIKNSSISSIENSVSQSNSASSSSKSQSQSSSVEASSSISGGSDLPSTEQIYVFNAGVETAKTGTKGNFSWKNNDYNSGYMKLKSVDNYIILSNISTTYAKVEVLGKCLDSSEAHAYKVIATYSDSTTDEISVNLPTGKAVSTQITEFDGTKTIVQIKITGVYTASKNLGVDTITVTCGHSNSTGSEEDGDQNNQTPIYLVSFDTDGGGQITSQEVEEGKKAQKPVNPSKTGFTFLYWMKNGLQFDFATAINENTTLVAKWQQNSQTASEKTYLDGILYGDEYFVERIKTADKREVETVQDIPNDAIFVSLEGSDSNTGTINSPYKSLSKALSKATSQIQNGGSGVILLREGTYGSTYFYSTAQGNKDNYVTITNYPGETVKISATDSTGLFHLGTSNYVIIEGLIFCDNVATSVAKGITASGNGINHIIIKNNEFYNIRVSALDGESNNGPIINFRGTKEGSPHNNFLVYNNYIHDCTTGWSEALTFVGNCEYINVIKNKIKDTGNIGIDIAGNWGDVSGAEDQARYVVVRGNITSGCNSPYARSYGLYCDGARDVIFENNISYGSQGGIEVGAENLNELYPVKNIIIRNNLVYNNTEKGIAIGGYSSEVGWVKNVEIYNNTIVNNGDNDQENNGQLTVSKAENVNIYNNIIAVSSADMYIYYESSSIPKEMRINVVYNNNLYYNNSTQESICFKMQGEKITGINNFKVYDQNAKFNDPLFKNWSANDYALLTNSPAIDKGISVPYANYDLDCNQRIVGSAIDIGCYEIQ